PEGGTSREGEAEQDEERTALQLHGDLLMRGLREGELRICEQEAPRIAAPRSVKYGQTRDHGPRFFWRGFSRGLDDWGFAPSGLACHAGAACRAAPVVAPSGETPPGGWGARAFQAGLETCSPRGPGPGLPPSAFVGPAHPPVQARRPLGSR